MHSDDLLHIQWTGTYSSGLLQIVYIELLVGFVCLFDICLLMTGSNSHKNGQPAGDGQAGDAGEGTSGLFCFQLN